MTCPKCEGTTTVRGNIPHVDNIVRKRICTECGFEFKTVEIDLDLWQSIEKSNVEAVRDSEPGGHSYRNLTEKEAIYILENYVKGSRDKGATAMAEKFGVARETIINLLNGRTKKWSDLLDRLGRVH